MSAWLCSISSPAAAQSTSAEATLFRKVRIFDGMHKSLSGTMITVTSGHEEGALADLLLVDGNPIENIALVADPARNFW